MEETNECENLLFAVALSASHIAFGSIRMEPVFMMLGQAAAIAASLALDAGAPVQDVPYKTLRQELLDVDQILEWTGPQNRRQPYPPPAPAWSTD